MNKTIGIIIGGGHIPNVGDLSIVSIINKALTEEKIKTGKSTHELVWAVKYTARYGRRIKTIFHLDGRPLRRKVDTVYRIKTYSASIAAAEFAFILHKL